MELEHVTGWGGVIRELAALARIAPSETPHAGEDSFERLLFDLPWMQVYDFCESLHSRLACSVIGRRGYDDEYVAASLADVREALSAEIERIFIDEGLAFSLVDGMVARRGRKHTVEQIDGASTVLGDPQLRKAREHFIKAQRFFRDAKNPDYPNVVKEAVCAVEAAGKALFPHAKASTLAKLVSWLTAESGMVPKSLQDSLGGLYAYRNAAEGATHGGTNGGPPSAREAEYVLSSAASQIVYLVSLRQEEESIPF